MPDCRAAFAVGSATVGVALPVVDADAFSSVAAGAVFGRRAAAATPPEENRGFELPEAELSAAILSAMPGIRLVRRGGRASGERERESRSCGSPVREK